MQPKSNVKKNFLYNAFYQILVIIIPLITTPYLARIIGPKGTGIYSYNQSIASYFSMFIVLGLVNYGSRTISLVKDKEEDIKKNFWSIYFTQFFCGIFVIICYLIYVKFWASNKVVAKLFIMYLVGYLFDVSWFLTGLEEFKTLTLRNTIIKIFTFISIFVFVKKETDVYKYVFIYTLGTLVSALLIWPIVLKRVKGIYYNFHLIVKHIKPNLILFVPVIAISLYKVMDKIMLGNMTNMKQVGYYESCERILNVPMAFINALGIVMLPRMTNLYKNNENITFSTYMDKSISFVMFLSTSISFGIMAVSKEFVPIFFGKGYSICINIFLILLPSVIFMGFANVIRTQYLIPKQKDRIYIFSIFFGAIVNLIINLLLIPKFQVIGACIGTFLAEFTVCISQILCIKKELPIKKYIFSSFKYFIIAIIMFFIIFFINVKISIGMLIIKVILGATIYITLLIILERIIFIKNEKR